jgi:hypothetical protein
MEKNKHANDSVEAGREYVAAYVEYVHFIEVVHNMVANNKMSREERRKAMFELDRDKILKGS